MGLFSKFAKQPKGYVPPDEFQRNLAKQLRMTPMTLAKLREFGVTEQTQLNLEYFFYTDTREKAAGLARALQGMGYSAEIDFSGHDDGRTLEITGWTTQIAMIDGIVVEWAKMMCELGFQHDCEFDGWGTLAKQEE